MIRINRRRSHPVHGIASDSSSDSSVSSDSSALDPEDFMFTGSVPQAPPSMLPVRPVRPRRDSDLDREMERDRQERADMVAALEQERLRRQRLPPSGTAGQNLRRQNSSILRRRPSPLAIEAASEEGTTPHHSLIPPRFIPPNLTSQAVQPEGSTQASPRDDPVSLSSLSSIYGASREESHRRLPPLSTSIESALAEEGAATGARREEFEAFASSRRYHRRPQSANETSNDAEAAPNGEEQDASEDETFYRALGTLFRADETIRLVSQEAEEADSAATTTRASARRFNLPPMSSERRVLRMPSRPARRGESTL